jgi:hypothetical protein
MTRLLLLLLRLLFVLSGLRDVHNNLPQNHVECLTLNVHLEILERIVVLDKIHFDVFVVVAGAAAAVAAQGNGPSVQETLLHNPNQSVAMNNTVYAGLKTMLHNHVQTCRVPPNDDGSHYNYRSLD